MFAGKLASFAVILSLAAGSLMVTATPTPIDAALRPITFDNAVASNPNFDPVEGIAADTPDSSKNTTTSENSTNYAGESAALGRALVGSLPLTAVAVAGMLVVVLV